MRKTTYLPALLALLLPGCSWFAAEVPVQERPLETVSVYVSRASLLQADYEQYKWTRPFVISECGSIRGGRYHQKEQHTVSVPPEREQALLRPLWELMQQLEAEQHPFAEPGKNSSLADPGQLFLEVKGPEQSLSIKTSADAASSPGTRYERLLLDVVERFRGLVPTAPCGNPTFYDIGRQE